MIIKYWTDSLCTSVLLEDTRDFIEYKDKKKPKH